jgi:predicted outer membrane repeat protein
MAKLVPKALSNADAVALLVLKIAQQPSVAPECSNEAWRHLRKQSGKCAHPLSGHEAALIVAAAIMMLLCLLLYLCGNGSAQLQRLPDCRSISREPIDVFNTADTASLVQIARCEGAVINAIWHGTVIIEETITVGPATTLSITAAPGSAAVLDGDGFIQLFVVSGTLKLADVTLQNGYNDEGLGGAVYVEPNARLTAKKCTFSQNSARFGSAIFADQDTNVLLQQVSSDLRSCHIWMMRL